MEFRWSDRKAIANLRKHGIAFEDAVTAFHDPLSRTIEDPDPLHGEQRFLLIGQSLSGRLLVVAHADFGGIIRIISARLATRREQRDYEEA